MMKRFPIAAFAVVLVLLSAPPSAAAEDTIVKAMRDEMARSVESLQLEEMERPFYIEYRVDDVHQHVVTASFGALVASNPSRSRLLTVDVRVGDHNLDNSEFMSTDMFRGGRFAQPRQLALDGDYYAIRRDIWLATDKHYKLALETLAKKRAHRENTVADEPVPDFSHEDVHETIDDVVEYEFDATKWEDRLRESSEIFKEFSEIDDSKVELRVQHMIRYYLNSEGTRYRKSELSAIVYASASTQADDGETLKHYVSFVMPAPGDLPGASAFDDAVREMASQLVALRSAPVLDDYTGPVMFSGDAAADVMLNGVGLQLVGQRVPESDIPQLGQLLKGPKLADRLGKRAMSNGITVYDDPTVTEFDGVALAGAYEVDDQGIPAQKVVLIEDGQVTSLLMSRRPRKEIQQSNGHARMPLRGVIGSAASVGNLFVEPEEPVSVDALKSALIELCDDEGLEFGLLVRSLDDSRLTGAEQQSPQAMMAMLQSQGVAMGAPIAVYKVYAADGREELVRGLSHLSLDVRALRDIVGMGDDTKAFNRLVSAGGGSFGGPGELRVSTSMPTSVVTPSFVVEEMDLKSRSGTKTKPTVLAHPSFSN